MEERFCELVKEMGCTCITISHRPALMAFHDLVLSLDGEGGWSLHPGHRSLEAKADAAATVEAGATAPPPPRPPSANGGQGRRGRKGRGKARGGEADAVLQGMTGGKEGQEEQLGDGNEGFSELVVARAPPAAAASCHAQTWAPRLGLEPAKLSAMARWKVRWTLAALASRPGWALMHTRPQACRAVPSAHPVAERAGRAAGGRPAVAVPCVNGGGSGGAAHAAAGVLGSQR
jgi:hypothetical protein